MSIQCIDISIYIYIYIIIDVAFLLNPHPHPIHPQVGAVRSLRHRHHQGQRLAWHQPDDPSDASDWLCLAAAEPDFLTQATWCLGDDELFGHSK